MEMRDESQLTAQEQFQEMLDEMDSRGVLQPGLYQIRVAVTIARELKRQRITRRELATRMGCSTANITQLLSGDQNLQAETVARLAEALGCEIEPFRLNSKNPPYLDQMAEAQNTPRCNNGSGFAGIFERVVAAAKEAVPRIPDKEAVPRIPESDGDRLDEAA